MIRLKTKTRGVIKMLWRLNDVLGDIENQIFDIKFLHMPLLLETKQYSNVPVRFRICNQQRRKIKQWLKEFDK